MIDAKTGKFVQERRYPVYDFIYESAEDQTFWKQAYGTPGHISPDPVTRDLNAQWIFNRGLAIPTESIALEGNVTSSIAGGYKGLVEEWFPGLGIWGGSNTVFT